MWGGVQEGGEEQNSPEQSSSGLLLRRPEQKTAYNQNHPHGFFAGRHTRTTALLLINTNTLVLMALEPQGVIPPQFINLNGRHIVRSQSPNSHRRQRSRLPAIRHRRWSID